MSAESISKKVSIELVEDRSVDIEDSNSPQKYDKEYLLAHAEEIQEEETPPILSRQMLPLLGSAFCVYFCSTSCGYDGSLMSSIYTQEDYLKYFNLSLNSSTATGLVFSIYNVGQIVCAPFCLLMDWRGRKFLIIFGAIGVVISALVTALAPNLSVLIAFRFFLSFFTQLANTAGSTYVTEISCTKHRGRIAGSYNCLWYIGSIIAAFTAFGSEKHYSGTTKAFKIPLYVQMCCPAIVGIFAWFIPESPRWLVGVGRVEDARKMLAKYHCNGDINNRLIDLEIAEMEESFKENKLASWSILDLRPLFRRRSDRYRTMLVVLMSFYGQFSGNNVCSYYLPTMLSNVGMTSQSKKVLMNAVYSIVSWVASVSGSFMHEVIGRRKMFLASTISAACCLTGLSVATAKYEVLANEASSNAALAFIYLFGICFSFAFTPMQPIYPAEVSSNALRSRNMIMNNLTSGVAQFINQFAAPKAMQNIRYWFYVFYVFWDISEAVVIYFFFVETKGKSLEELDVIFTANNPRKASTGNYSSESEETIMAITNHLIKKDSVDEKV